jgi:hypothetical protein
MEKISTTFLIFKRKRGDAGAKLNFTVHFANLMKFGFALVKIIGLIMKGLQNCVIINA